MRRRCVGARQEGAGRAQGAALRVDVLRVARRRDRVHVAAKSTQRRSGSSSSTAGVWCTSTVQVPQEVTEQVAMSCH
jgi:hypothetical protein